MEQQLKEGTLLNGGKYRIKSVLGQGGFGITYLAATRAIARGNVGQLTGTINVAVKEFFMKDLCERNDQATVSVPSTGSINLVERFKQKFVKEAHVIASLSHPNIIRVADIFEENNTAYYVMEYLSDDSLSNRLKRLGHFDEATALRMITQIGKAVGYLHRNHIVHLDIKPSNVLLRSNDEVVLIDFGTSKRYDADGGQTSTTPVGLSHGYAPLEQYRKGGVNTFSPSTDIYSMGATLYKMLTGDTPPEASALIDEPLSFPATISAYVQNAISKAMSPGRSQRPQSVEEWFQDLQIEETELHVEQPIGEETAILSIDIDASDTIYPDESAAPESHFPKKRGNGTFEAVDLGLSVCWATCNIGAKEETESGGLYGWADPTGEKESTEAKDYVPLAAYLSHRINSDISGTEYDLATVKGGEGWHIPTAAQWKELAQTCEWTWDEDRKGYRVKGRNSNSIFLPVTGLRNGSSIQNKPLGYYWSSNMAENTRDSAYYFYFNADSHNSKAYMKSLVSWGFGIRPVCEK